MLLAALAWWAAPARSEVAVGPGQPIPDLVFQKLLAPGDYAKLGLDKTEGPVALSEIPGQVLVLEFFNKNCVPCQRQVRHLETLYRKIQEEGLDDRVKILAVGAGNKFKYLPKYRKRRKMTYPVTADPTFDQWRRVGDPGRTPFTVHLVRVDGTWIWAGHTFGVIEADELERQTRALLDAPDPTAVAAGAESLEVPELRLPVSRETVERMVRALLTRVVGEPVDAVRHELQDGTVVYQAVREGERLLLYAKVASRRAICEVCDPVHFVFAFSGDGRLQGFVPIHVTKYGNKEWTPEDVRFFEERLKGREFRDFSFDPAVDAVTRATMSSAIIFDEVRRTADLLDELPGR